MSGTKKSRSERAGLTFPVGRVSRFIREGRYASRVGELTPICVSAVMEYIVAEIIELSGNAAKDNKRTRISPRHIRLAIEKDEELSEMFGHATIVQGGVVPNIHPSLLPPKKKNNLNK